MILRASVLLILGTMAIGSPCRGDILPDPGPAAKDRVNEALMLAATEGSINKVRALLRNKVDLEYKRRQGPALFEAASRGHTEIVSLLLDHGARIGSRRGIHERTPLHGAIEGEEAAVVRLLLKRRAPIELTDDLGDTPLRLAAKGGNLAILTMLLDAGARIDASDQEDGATALHIATAYNHPECVTALLRRGASASLSARSFWRHDTYYRRPSDYTPLRLAVAEGHLEAVKALLDARVNLEASGADGSTALDLAIIEWGSVATRPLVATLLAAGADPNRVGKLGYTPLQLAARDGHLASLTQLLDAGARIDEADAEGATALHLAAAHNHPDCVTALLRRGASAAVAAHDFWPQERPDGGSYRSDYTALRVAAFLGNLEVVKVLLAAGAHPDLSGGDGRTALALAITGRWAVDDIRTAIMEALLAAHADPNRADAKGKTPLLCAARAGDAAAARVLLRAGADPTRRAERDIEVLAELRAMAERAPELKPLLARYPAGLPIVGGGSPGARTPKGE